MSRAYKKAKAIEYMRATVLGWSRATKRLILLVFDSSCAVLAALIALAALPGDITLQPHVPVLLAASALCTIPMFAAFGLYRSVVRALGSRIMYVLAGAVLAAALVLAAASFVLLDFLLPWTAVVQFAFMLLALVGGGRMVARDLLNRAPSSAPRVVIYGAGTAGMRLAEAMAASGSMRLTAFVDDEPRRQGALVRGIRVEPPHKMARLVHRRGVSRVLLAMPRATRRRRAEILESLRPLGVAVQTVPELSDIVSGAARIDEIRDVQIADLLGRDVVPAAEATVDACVRGKCVLVTGAGGSIGSELCRQILRHDPARLVLLEISEHALYQIGRELRTIAAREGHAVEIVALLGSAHFKARVLEIMRIFAVHTVYHAAAYKHVPIVEQNIIEGIHNNVIGTWYTAAAAIEAGVETFVLISTDKAVNPPNVMGATKRCAEIVLQGLQRGTRATRFCMVRFGNVLGSSGSVVPLFHEQIRRGGPVTVTHPEVSRYFMTIPEAVNLVLQAGSIGSGGDVLVLEMGKPVRIADLARRMIELSGFSVRDADHPDGDIEIHFTGLRPAEKLHEELLIGKNVSGTGHPMIMRAVEHFPPWETVQLQLYELLAAMEAGNVSGARAILEKIVEEYEPAADPTDLVWQRVAESGKGAVLAAGPATAIATVTDLASRRIN